MTSRVLMVDDRQENLTALRAVLEPLDVPIVEVHSGEDALRELLTDQFALILLDVDMPHMDGFQTAELIKRHPRTARIPIIFLTAFDEPLARAGEGYSFGAVDYIAKPCDPFVLRAKVQVFLDLHDKNALLERQAGQLERHVEQLRASRAALADAQRIANLGSWEYDPRSGRVRGSRQFHEIFGIPADVPLPPAAELFARIELEGDARDGTVLLHTATRANFEGRLQRADGVRHVVLHVEPKTDALTTIGTIQDVTQQREARRALDTVTRALEHERELVQLFQDTVAAPSIVQGPDLYVSYCYRPAQSAVVGGDWYDVLQLRDGDLLLAIGDVAGHGLPAAAAMADIRAALRVLAMRESSPAQIMHELSIFLYSSRPGVFATMLALRFDPRTGTCTVASAGHPPPVEIGLGEATLRDVQPDPMLGVAPSARAGRETTFVLGRDRTIVLYTDGLIERRRESIDEGFARLAKCLAGLSADAPKLADEIVQLCALAHDLQDDVAVLTLYHRGVDTQFQISFPAEVREIAARRLMLRRWLESFGVTAPAVDDALLAVCEVVANACLHAYPPGADGTVQLEARFDGDSANFIVTDHGRWRESRGAPSSRGGHGLQIAMALAPGLTIDRGSDGTTVTMRVPLGGIS
ncbi:MAG TPA: SpoIIE family protein phosphatase [Acidimicrobiia bacterium]|nr:SpoIIE family protein phosphatase [Acidimicrobiia bacterium]